MYRWMMIFLMPALSYAQGESGAVAHPSGVLLQTLVGLLLVVGFIFALAYVAKKLNLANFGQGRDMKVMASLSLGTREKALLIDVAGKQFLIGVAPGRVSALHAFAEPAVFSESPNNHQAKLSANTASEFSKKLNEFLNLGTKT